MNNKDNNQDSVEQLPFMKNPQTDIEYKMNWWKNKSISGVEDKGGSFNMQLYLDYLRIRKSSFQSLIIR